MIPLSSLAEDLREKQFPHDSPICSPVFSAGGVGRLSIVERSIREVDGMQFIFYPLGYRDSTEAKSQSCAGHVHAFSMGARACRRGRKGTACHFCAGYPMVCLVDNRLQRSTQGAPPSVFATDLGPNDCGELSVSFARASAHSSCTALEVSGISHLWLVESC